MATNQILTFRLASTEYGVGVLNVQEIRGWSAVTRIPDTPPQILGVLNLRGAVVPVIDLRLRFGQENPAMTPLTTIIVVSIGTPERHRECGLVVDGVSDVIELPPAAIRPAPRLRDSPASAYVEGVATLEDRMIVLLDMDALVSEELLPPNTQHGAMPADSSPPHAAA